MKKYTNGDLEQAIMMCGQTSEDLELFFRYHGDAPTPMTEDEVANALLGIKLLNDMRVWNAEDMHCRVAELNQYCTDPVKLAKREEYGTKPKRSTSK